MGQYGLIWIEWIGIAPTRLANATKVICHSTPESNLLELLTGEARVNHHQSILLLGEVPH